MPRATVTMERAQEDDMEDRLLRLPEVKSKTGMSRTTIYRRMMEGHFPRSVDLGGGTVAWRLSDVNRWMAGLDYTTAKAS